MPFFRIPVLHRAARLSWLAGAVALLASGCGVAPPVAWQVVLRGRVTTVAGAPVPEAAIYYEQHYGCRGADSVRVQRDGGFTGFVTDVNGDYRGYATFLTDPEETLDYFLHVEPRAGTGLLPKTVSFTPDLHSKPPLATTRVNVALSPISP